jgi:hypothetical protein
MLTGLVVESGAAVYHKLYDNYNKCQQMIISMDYYKDETCIPLDVMGREGKEKLKDVFVENCPYNIFETVRYMTLDEIRFKNLNKIGHDHVHDLLSSIFGYWNVEDLEYGLYMESSYGEILDFNQEVKMFDIPFGYHVLRILVTNDTLDNVMVNVGSGSLLTDVIQEHVLAPGESIDERIEITGMVSMYINHPLSWKAKFDMKI